MKIHWTSGERRRPSPYDATTLHWRAACGRWVPLVQTQAHHWGRGVTCWTCRRYLERLTDEVSDGT